MDKKLEYLLKTKEEIPYSKLLKGIKEYDEPNYNIKSWTKKAKGSNNVFKNLRGILYTIFDLTKDEDIGNRDHCYYTTGIFIKSNLNKLDKGDLVFIGEYNGDYTSYHVVFLYENEIVFDTYKNYDWEKNYEMKKGKSWWVKFEYLKRLNDEFKKSNLIANSILENFNDN